MRNPKEGVCAIWVQDLALSEQTLRDILTLSITFREGKAATGSLTMSDKDFIYMDSKVFRKNQKLSFVLGLVDDAVPMGPFIIKEFHVEAGDDGHPTLSVDFQDLTHLLAKKKEKIRYNGGCVPTIKTAIAELNAQGKKVSYNIDTPKDVKFDDEKALIQANKTKAQIINSLAERYGFVWGIEGQTLYFRKPVDLETSGKQAFVPVLSYRMNDCSLFSYRAEFKYAKEGIRKGSKKVTENIDFEKCEDVGSWIKDVFNGKIDAPPELLEYLGMEGEAIALAPDEDTAKEALGEAKLRATSMFDQSKTLFNNVDFNDLPSLLTGQNPTDMFAKDTNDFTKKIEEIYKKNKGINSNTEEGTTDESGTSTPDSEEEATKRAEAHLYRSVVLCDADIVPTVYSPRYKPSMAVVLAGLGMSLSGKYKVLEVNHSYSDNSYSMNFKAQKRLYGLTDSDKKRIAAATKAVEEGDNSNSTPGGSDKKTSTEETGYATYDVETNKWAEVEEVKIVNGVRE